MKTRYYIIAIIFSLMVTITYAVSTNGDIIEIDNSSRLLFSNQTIDYSALTIMDNNNTEILRIEYDGKVYHMGELVGNNSELPDRLAEAFGTYASSRGTKTQEVSVE